MSHVTLRAEDWEAMPSRAYANWFSTLEGMRSPVLIGTRSAGGVDNLAVFNSLTHIGARPPLLAFVLRPLTVERHTYDNLKASGFYTVNHVTTGFLQAAHDTSAKFECGVSEFERVGLTPLDATGGAAPYVAESPVSMLLEFREEHHVSANDTVIVVGAVREIRVPTSLAEASREVDWAAQQAVVVSGLYRYYSVAFRQNLGYVRPADIPAASGR